MQPAYFTYKHKMLIHIIDRPWKISLLTFLLVIGSGLLLVMLLNQNIVNAIYQPILQYWSLFLVLWQDDPVGALQFIVTKSILAFAHQDPRSGLKLWTYEIDSVTLTVYILSAVAFALVVHKNLPTDQSPISKQSQKHISIALVGAMLLIFSFSYMTAIKHCAGATWVGYVSAYGLGADEFERYPIYQTIGAIVGSACLGLALYLSSNTSSDSNTNSNTIAQQTNASAG